MSLALDLVVTTCGHLGWSTDRIMNRSTDFVNLCRTGVSHSLGSAQAGEWGQVTFHGQSRYLVMAGFALEKLPLTPVRLKKNLVSLAQDKVQITVPLVVVNHDEAGAFRLMANGNDGQIDQSSTFDRLTVLGHESPCV